MLDCPPSNVQFILLGQGHFFLITLVSTSCFGAHSSFDPLYAQMFQSSQEASLKLTSTRKFVKLPEYKCKGRTVDACIQKQCLSTHLNIATRPEPSLDAPCLSLLHMLASEKLQAAKSKWGLFNDANFAYKSPSRAWSPTRDKKTFNSLDEYSSLWQNSPMVKFLWFTYYRLLWELAIHVWKDEVGSELGNIARLPHHLFMAGKAGGLVNKGLQFTTSKNRHSGILRNPSKRP